MTITKENGMDQEIKDRIVKGNICYLCYRECSAPKVSREKQKYCVLRQILYGSSLGINNGYRGQNRTFENNVLRRVYGSRH